MLHRKLYQYYSEERPVWVFLRDQQRWIEEAMVVEIQADLVTLRYDDEDDDERQTWEESVRLDSIGAVSTRLAYVNRVATAEDLATTGDCPETCIELPESRWKAERKRLHSETGQRPACKLLKSLGHHMTHYTLALTEECGFLAML